MNNKSLLLYFMVFLFSANLCLAAVNTPMGQLPDTFDVQRVGGSAYTIEAADGSSDSSGQLEWSAFASKPSSKENAKGALLMDSLRTLSAGITNFGFCCNVSSLDVLMSLMVLPLCRGDNCPVADGSLTVSLLEMSGNGATLRLSGVRSCGFAGSARAVAAQLLVQHTSEGMYITVTPEQGGQLVQHEAERFLIGVVEKPREGEMSDLNELSIKDKKNGCWSCLNALASCFSGSCTEDSSPEERAYLLGRQTPYVAPDTMMKFLLIMNMSLSMLASHSYRISKLISPL